MKRSTASRPALALAVAAPLLAVALLATGHAGAAASPRRVVLFIGDGMGVPHVTLGRLAAERLHRPYPFDRMPAVGLADTRSANRVVTDSSAAATALSAGYKTNNGFLGVDPERRARRTISELAHRAGMKTGLVTTTRITHATPAAFAAHVTDRNDERTVAEQYAAGSVDVLLGGGLDFMTPHLAAFERAGYAVVTSAAALRAAKPAGKLVGVFTADHLSYEIDRDPAREPSLREMTEKALDVLASDGAPFFLMVEGGRIDHAAHKHDAAALVRDQLAFADAIDAALERCERGGDLLVVVTADHTTGGVGVTENLDLDALLAVRTSAERIVKAHPLGELTSSYASFRTTFEEAYHFTPTEKDLETVRRGGDAYVTTNLAHVASERRGVAFFDLELQHHGQPLTHGHEGSLVPVFAAGRGAESFVGLYDDTRVALELARLLGLPRPGERIPDFGKRFY